MKSKIKRYDDGGLMESPDIALADNQLETLDQGTDPEELIRRKLAERKAKAVPVDTNTQQDTPNTINVEQDSIDQKIKNKLLARTNPSAVKEDPLKQNLAAPADLLKKTQRQKDLESLTGAIKLPPGIDTSQIRIEDMGSYVLPKSGISLPSNLKKAVLPNGEMYVFATGHTTIGDKLYDLASVTIPEAIVVGAANFIDIANNAAIGAFMNSPLRPIVEPLYNATIKSKERDEKGFWYTPLANASRDIFDSYKPKIGFSEEYLKTQKQLQDKLDAGQVDALLTEPLYWKNLFTDETFHNELMPAMESMGEFMIPGAAAGKLSLGTKVLAPILTSALTKLNWSEKAIAKMGAVGDVFSAALMSGSLESHIEGENNGEAIAVDYYNNRIGDGDKVRNMEDINSLPDSALKQEAVDNYYRAYHDIFSANQIPLTILNSIPMYTILKGPKLKVLSGSFALDYPITSTALTIGGNIVSEGTQETFQTGVQNYESDKILFGQYPYGDNVLGDIVGSAERGYKDFNKDIETTTSAILGGLMGGSVGITDINNAIQQTRNNKEVKKYLQNTPMSDLSSIQGVVENGKINMPKLTEKVNALNSYLIHDKFTREAEKLGDVDLMNYAYQQSVSGIVYDGLKAGLDEDTLKHQMGKLIKQYTVSDSTSVDAEGNVKSASDIVSDQMQNIDQVMKAFKQTEKIASEKKLPEKIKQATYSTIVGRNFFSNLIGTLSDKLGTIDSQIIDEQEKIAKYGRDLKDIAEGEVGWDEVDGLDVSEDSIDELKSQRTTVRKKLIDSIKISNNYSRILNQILKKGEIKEFTNTARKNRIMDLVNSKLSRRDPLDHDIETEKGKRDLTDKIITEDPSLDPEDVKNELDKRTRELTKAKEDELRISLPNAANLESATIEDLVSPPGLVIEPWEHTLRTGIVQKIVENQAKEADKVNPEERYDGRPLLLQVEGEDRWNQASPEEKNAIADRMLALKGLPPGAKASFVNFFSAPFSDKIKDPAFRAAIKETLISEAAIKPTPSPTVTTTDGVDEQKNKNKEELSDTKKEVDSDVSTDVDDVDSIIGLERESRNEESVAVYHLIPPAGLTNDDVKTLYTLTAQQHADGVSLLHMGLINPEDTVHLEIEPGLVENDKEDRNWKNLVIQVVIYKNDTRYVVGQLHYFSTKKATLELRAIRQDIWNQWIKDKSFTLKTDWSTTVKEIYKGNHYEIAYENAEQDLPLTGEMLSEAGIPLSAVNIGLNIGTQSDQTGKATGGDTFNIHSKRNTLNPETGTGFIQLLIKSHKKYSAKIHHKETIGLFTRRVGDIEVNGVKVYKEAILKGIRENNKTDVLYLVKYRDKETRELLPNWRFNDWDTVENVRIGKQIFTIPPKTPYLIVGDKVIIGAEGIYDALQLDGRPVNIDQSWIEKDSPIATVSHPVFDNLNVKELVIKHLTRSNIDPNSHVYSIDGVTHHSIFHSAKFSVNNWNKSIPIEDVVPSPEAVEKPKIRRGKAKITEEIPNIVWEDTKKSEQWFRKTLEEIGYIVNDEELEKLHGLLKLDETSNVWGLAKDAAVTLASKRPQGSTRHEAFHIVFNLFLNDAQREQAYKEAWKAFGHKITVDGRQATEEEFEQALKEKLFDENKYSIGINEINYVLKSADILQSQKAIDWFKKRDKAQWKGDLFYDKLSSELGIPKDQVDILKSLNLTNPYNREELLSNLLDNYGFKVEINTATRTDATNIRDQNAGFNIYERDGKYWSVDPSEGGYPEETTKQIYDAWVEASTVYEKPVATQIYSNMTSPGGTNYREVKFTTPAIKPSIKGHAQFATANDIGWARVDEKAFPTFSGEPDLYDERKLTTRRVLEMQSDLFQKGRDAENLIDKQILSKSDIPALNGSPDIEEYLRGYEYHLNVINTPTSEISKLVAEERRKLEKKIIPTKHKENQFLQLLNKDNSWVTFFIKSLIQDSIKQGYEKVLFPSGDTAMKVEGLTTLENYKRQKQSRIVQLEGKIEALKLGIEQNPTHESLKSDLKSAEREQGQIQVELQRIEKEGFGALQPIFKFYEEDVKNNIDNLLGGNVKDRKAGIWKLKNITDEYGNTWTEVDLSDKGVQEKVSPIKLKTDASEYYEGQGILTQLEEEMAKEFEHLNTTGIFSEDFKAKHPTLAKLLQSLYDFLFTKFDTLKQYFRDDRDLKTLYRQIDNNSFGRNFLGQRRKSYTEVLNQNVAKRSEENSPGANYKITDIQPALISKRIETVNVSYMNRILARHYKNEDGTPRDLHDVITEGTVTTADSKKILANVYQKIKDYIINERIPEFEKERTEEEDPALEKTIKDLRVIADLINPDVIRGVKQKFGTQAFDFTVRLQYDLKNTQNVIFKGSRVVSQSEIDEAVQSESFDNSSEEYEGKDFTGGTITSDEIDSHESWQIDSFAQVAYDKISPRLRMEIASIPLTEEIKDKHGNITIQEQVNDLGEVKYHDPRNVFTILVNTISSSKNSRIMTNKIEKLRLTNPIIDSVMAKIQSYELAKQNALRKDMYLGIGNKYKVTYLMNLSDGDNIRVFPSNRKNVAIRIATEFRINFNQTNWDFGTNTAKSNIGGVSYEDFNKQLNELNPELRNKNLPKLLEALGFTITEAGAEYLAANVGTKNNLIYDHLRYIVGLMERNTNPTFFGEAGKGGAVVRIDQIAEELRNSDPSIDLNTFTDGKNKLVSGHVSVGLIIKKFYELKNSINDSKVPEERDAAYNALKADNAFPYFKDAPLLKWLDRFAPKGARDIGLDIAFFDSRKRNSADEGERIDDMSEADMHVNHIEMFIGGLVSRKKTEPFEYSWERKQFKNTWYNIAVPDSPKTYYFKAPLFESFIDLQVQYLDLWRQEKGRIDALIQAKKEDPNFTTGNEVYDKNGLRFHFFPDMNKNIGKYIGETATEKDALELIKSSLEKYYKNYLDKLESLGVISIEKGKVNPTSLMSDIHLNGKTFEETLKLFFYNDNLMTTQAITLLSGDPASYKGSSSVGADYQKRNKSIHANGIYGDFLRELYSVAYLKDIKLSSKDDFIESVRNMLTLKLDDKGNRISGFFIGDVLENILNAYKFDKDGDPAHNTTDAQGYVTLERWKEILEAFNMWKPAHQRAYDNLVLGTPTKEDLYIVSQPLKPHYFGFKERNGFKLPLYHKYSAVVLHPMLLKDNPMLSKIADKMKLGVIDEVIFESGVKVGNVKTVSLDDFLNASEDALYSLTDVVPNEFYKEQQKVPEHFKGKVKNLLGIQFRKIVLANIALNRVYTDDATMLSFYNKAYDENKTELNGEDMVRIVDKLLSDNISNDLKALVKKIINKDTFRSILQDAILDKELGSNYSTAAERGPDGDFKMPLWFPTISRKMEEIYTSLFKDVSKQKHNGGSFVNMSNLGFDDSLGIKINDDGTFYVEIALAMNSDLIGRNTDTGVLEKIRDGIVYRIPTEEKYSMFPVKVVKWLDSSVGGVIAMPREITTIAGLDFDIDKVYSLMYNFSIVNGEAEITRDPRTREGRENLLLDSYRAVLSSHETFKDMIRVQSIQPLKDIRTKLGLNKEDDLPISLRQKQTEYVARNQAGKNLIGIFANNNSFHALAMFADGVTLSNKAYGQIMIGSLSSYRSSISGTLNSPVDSKDNQISRTFAMLLSAAVDNAKDPVLGDLNINEFTAPMLSLMLHMGIPVSAAIRRLNDPDMLQATKLFFTKGQREATTNEDIKNIFSVARSLAKVVSALRIDSGIGPTLHDVDKKISDIQSIYEGKTILIGKGLLPEIYVNRKTGRYVMNNVDSTVPLHIRDYMNVLITEANEASEYFPYFDTKFIDVKTTLDSFQPSWMSMASKNRRTADLEHLAVIHHSLFKISDNYENISDFIANFPNDFYVARNKIREDENASDAMKNLFSQFVPDDNNRLILFDKNSIDKNFQQILSEQWESGLKYENEEIQKLMSDLLSYGFYTSGYMFTRSSYMHIAPTEFFYERPEFKNYNRLSNLSAEHVALHIALNNPLVFGLSFKNPYFTHRSQKDLDQLVTKTELEVPYYAPMYSVREGDSWAMYLNNDYMNDGFMNAGGLIDPTYTKVRFIDPLLKARIIHTDISGLQELNLTTESEMKDNTLPDETLNESLEKDFPTELTEDEVKNMLGIKVPTPQSKVTSGILDPILKLGRENFNNLIQKYPDVQVMYVDTKTENYLDIAEDFEYEKLNYDTLVNTVSKLEKLEFEYKGQINDTFMFYNPETDHQFSLRDFYKLIKQDINEINVRIFNPNQLDLFNNESIAPDPDIKTPRDCK